MQTNNITVELGNRILNLRQKLSISQAELARRSDLSKTYLGEFERGQRQNISITAVARIAEALGVTLSDLFKDIEISDESWEDEDSFLAVLCEKKIEDACYPVGLEGFSVTTLMQFLVYLPLLQPQYILDSLLRIGGSFEGYESYILKQINFCISKIPNSCAKQYADICATRLSRDVHVNGKSECSISEEIDKGYDDYITRIKQIDTFFKCYRMMKENGL